MIKHRYIVTCITLLISAHAYGLSSGQKGGLVAGAIGLAGTAATGTPQVIVPVTLASAAVGGLIGKSKERKGRKRRRSCCNKMNTTTQTSNNAINS